MKLKWLQFLQNLMPWRMNNGTYSNGQSSSSHTSQSSRKPCRTQSLNRLQSLMLLRRLWQRQKPNRTNCKMPPRLKSKKQRLEKSKCNIYLYNLFCNEFGSKWNRSQGYFNYSNITIKILYIQLVASIPCILSNYQWTNIIYFITFIIFLSYSKRVNKLNVRSVIFI